MSMRIRVMGRFFTRHPLPKISEVTGDDRRRIISNMGPLLSDGLVKEPPGIDQSIEYSLTDSPKEKSISAQHEISRGSLDRRWGR